MPKKHEYKPDVETKPSRMVEKFSGLEVYENYTPTREQLLRDRGWESTDKLEAAINYFEQN